MSLCPKPQHAIIFIIPHLFKVYVFYNINNIENGINLPSMQAFFYICEYLEITPKEFFDTDTVNPMMISELTEAAKRLSSDQLRNLISLAKGLK